MTTQANEFTPDAFALDQEWVKQPVLAHDYGLELADAKMCHERAKAELELVEAELDQEIRLHPGNFGIEKLTEMVIEKTIIRQKSYQKARADEINARHALDVQTAANRAVDSKKSALENLVVLQGRDYYAEPRLPRGMGEQMAEREQKVLREKARRRSSD